MTTTLQREAAHRPGSARALVLALHTGLALALLAGAGPAAAGPDPVTGQRIPRQIPYRGLIDRAGLPMSDGSIAMTFRLYAAPTGGAALWTETQPEVSVQGGRFSVALGEVVPIPAALFAQADLYLEVGVAGTELLGRQRLYSVPYAHHAAASSATPAGSLMAFAGRPERAPAGWLPCDGRTLSAAAYPALFAAIGHDYGGAGDAFSLPDARGRFLRGADAGAGRDPGPRDGAQAQDWSTGMARSGFAATVTPLGHSHTYADFYGGVGGCGPALNRPLNSIEGTTVSGRCEEQRTSAAADQSHGHAVSGGDAETRPGNIAVTWIIRVID